MTTKELIDLRKFALSLIRDEDKVQDILINIIQNNLSFKLALNYIKLASLGSAFYKRRLDPLNNSISISLSPADTDNCTIEETIPAMNQTDQLDTEQFFETLTEKEAQILNLILDGFTARETCKLLKISSKTYSKHIKSIRKKALEFFT